jgi:hypothetical protein
MSHLDPDIEACARAAHEANRAYCLTLGDASQVPWDEAPEWQRKSVRNGVWNAIKGAAPEESHENWIAHKKADGWVYGPVKDPEKKTHPCMVPYVELPPEQQRKNALFGAVVRAMRSALRMGGAGVGMVPRAGAVQIARQFEFLVRNSLGEYVETHEVVPCEDGNLALSRAVIPGRTLMGDLARGPDYVLIALGATEPKTRFRVVYRRTKSMLFDRLACDSSAPIRETVVLVDCQLTLAGDEAAPQRAEQASAPDSPPRGD